jgi:hypothetical protein
MVQWVLKIIHKYMKIKFKSYITKNYRKNQEIIQKEKFFVKSKPKSACIYNTKTLIT